MNLRNHERAFRICFHRKKFEIATDEVGNFIKQDEKKGVLREVSVICIKLLSLLIASL